MYLRRVPVPRHPPGAALTQGSNPQAYPRLGVLLWRTKNATFRGDSCWHPDLCWYAVMSNQDQLRNRAAHLLAMALKAREEGHLDYAEHFTQRASEILNQSTALERLGTQGGHP
jgi:hypothetical protein